MDAWVVLMVPSGSPKRLREEAPPETAVTLVGVSTPLVPLKLPVQVVAPVVVSMPATKPVDVRCPSLAVVMGPGMRPVT